ncbi:HD domain-containing protein [Candidatus Parcubacteria bacterium]|nr:HD domain-containing protein [Candidatus Parcubacteria bacterium]
MKKTSSIVNFLFEIASLRRIFRSQCQMIEKTSDNISDHSFRVAIIGMILAKLEKADENKIMKMCLFHDIAEARTGDANFVNKFYAKLDEEQALKDQLENIPNSSGIISLFKEYEQRKTKESLIAKDADILDQMILQQEYFSNDGKNRKTWQVFSKKKLNTKSAKEIAESIEKTNPLQWIYSIADKNKVDYK